MAIFADATAGQFIQKIQHLNVSKGKVDEGTLAKVKDLMKKVQEGKYDANGFCHYEAGKWQWACVDGFKTADNMEDIFHNICILPISPVRQGSVNFTKYMEWSLSNRGSKTLVIAFGDVFIGQQMKPGHMADFLRYITSLPCEVEMLVGDHHLDTIKVASDLLWNLDDMPNLTLTMVYSDEVLANKEASSATWKRLGLCKSA